MELGTPLLHQADMKVYKVVNVECCIVVISVHFNLLHLEQVAHTLSFVELTINCEYLSVNKVAHLSHFKLRNFENLCVVLT